LKRRLPDLRLVDIDNAGDAIDIALIWKVPPGLERFGNLRAILSLGAGVDQLDLDTLPKNVPLARLKDDSLTACMIDYCRLAVLRYHRDFHLYERLSREGGPWRYELPKRTSERCVGILGLGELGGAVAGDLVSAGFQVAGWSRSRKEVAGVRSCIGPEGLEEIAAMSEILINLLPLTPQTENILNRQFFSKMRVGSYLINVGRGRHLAEDDLLWALDEGRLAGATLDVFRTEPLPAGHPFWGDRRILVTPHIAAAGNPETAADYVAENIRRALRGERLLNQVDVSRGY
jgi:glyoxylate/hydroxypyruvate reductase A